MHVPYKDTLAIAKWTSWLNMPSDRVDDSLYAFNGILKQLSVLVDRKGIFLVFNTISSIEYMFKKTPWLISHFSVKHMYNNIREKSEHVENLYNLYLVSHHWTMETTAKMEALVSTYKANSALLWVGLSGRHKFKRWALWHCKGSVRTPLGRFGARSDCLQCCRLHGGYSKRSS